jgi:hypothetical protein
MNMPGRRVEQVSPSDDLGYPLIEIVYDHCQMVCHKTISTPDYEVAGVSLQPLRPETLQQVVKLDRFIVGADAYGCTFRFTAGATGAWINRAEWSLSGTREILPRAPATVSQAGVDQLRGSATVARGTSALVDNVAVPLETIRIQRRDNDGRSTRLLARGIDVLDAQQPAAAAGTRLQVACDCREQGSEMQGAGW